MIFEIFQNGSDKVNRRLMTIEIGLAQVAVGIAAIQGFLPSQDWIPAKYMKPIAFGLALVAIGLKVLETFFSKTAALYQTSRDATHKEEATSNTETLTK